MKRVTWFVSGVVAGAASVVLLGRRIKRRVADLAPIRVAERALDRTRTSLGNLRSAVDDGRKAMVERERELRNRLSEHEYPEDGVVRRPVQRSR